MKQFSTEKMFSRAILLIALVLTMPFCGVFAQTTQTFTTPGTTTWTCPYGVSSITVETWGGGGAGGGATNKAGGGGGGGGYNTTTISVSYGNSYSYTVGAGGVGASAANGPAGGASSFNSVCIAGGGNGGTVGTTTDGAGGTGGTGLYTGGNGATAVTNSGGGGGAAGSANNGGNGGVTAAGTGGTVGGGAGAAGRSSNGDGADATGVGGGGAGAKNTGAAKIGGSGANGQVKITYTITCTAPPAQATGLVLTGASSTSIGGTFTASAYSDGYLVVRTTTSTQPSNPVNGTTYVAGNSALGGVIVQSSSATSFTASSLTANTQYWFWVYSYNNSGCVGGITYQTASPLSDNGYTACVAPSAAPTSLVLTPSSYSVAVSWTASATADGYIVVRTPTSTVGSPVNGTIYTVGQSALSGTIDYVGTGTGFTSTGLSANTTYFYTVYGYKNVTCSVIAYKTTALKTSTTTLLPPCSAPTAQPTSLILTPAASAIAGSFTAEPSAYGYLVVRTTTSSAPSNPVDGTTYAAGNTSLGGVVIQSSTATTFNSASLTAGQQYWYWVYAYNDVTCSGGIKYYTTSPLSGSSYTSCATPSAQATSLSLTPGSYNISGSFTASGSADSYLVIRMTSNTAVTAPTDGTTYTVGTSALGGYVVAAGTSTSFNDVSLSSSTQYWYTIFAYNSVSCSVPAYRTGTPLKANTTTLTPPCSAPAAQPTSLSFSPVYSESLTGSFTATTADGYLVVRTTTSTQPTNPSNATTYTAGSTALGGTIVSVGSATTWNSSTIGQLTPNTTYWYWVYAYNNSGCTGGPVYRTTSPLTGSVTTSAAGTWTNTVTITTPGNATYSWKALSWSLGHVPTASENAELILNNSGTSADAIVVDLDTTITVYSYTMTNTSSPANYKHVFSTTGNYVFTCLNDMTLTSPGGHKYNRTVFCNLGGTYIYGNLTLGRYPAGSTDGHASIGSTGSTPNQTFTMYGNMIFNPRGYTTDEWAKFIFDKAGTQYIYNNTVTTDTIAPVLFENLVIGQTNATTLIMAGTAYDSYIENVRAAGVTIGANSVLDLPNGYSLTKFSGGYAEPFTLGAGATLRLGGDKTMDRSNVVNGISGSNFPSNFSPYTLHSTSTVDYYGSSSITQTIYSGVTYGNLLIKNGPGTGRAAKISTGAVTASTSINVNALADWNLGNTVSSAGPFNVNSTGGLYCATNTVSGAGAFTLASGGYLGMGSPNGITSGTTASGNIQMTGGRSFSTGGNYIYNGSVAQVTGNGLPTTCNDLYADNPTTVTIANSQTVTGLNKLAQGTFDIGSTKLKITGNGTLSSTGGKMKANLGQLEMNGSSGTAQSLSGSWFVNRNISTLINSNTTGITLSATANDTLLVASALLYGSGTTNSTITTNNNLTLLSRDTATARFGEIVSGSGNSITGNVTVERYVGTGRKWRLFSWPTVSTQTAKQSWMENNSANGNTLSGYGTIVTDDKSTWSANGFDSRSVSGPSVKYWDPTTSTFIGIPNTTSFQMSNQVAYFNFVRGNRASLPSNSTNGPTILRSTGTLKTGNQSFTINATRVEPVGNPYASAIDLRLLDTANITSTFYVWDPKLTGSWTLGAYQTIYANGGTYRVMPGGGSYGALNSVVDTIESGQAFFVQARSSNGTVTFKESSKTIGARTVNRLGSVGEAAYAMLSIVDTAKTLVDGSMCAFGSQWDNNVDFDDAVKMTNGSENVSFRRNAKQLSIERRQRVVTEDTLFINISGMRVHTYHWDIILDEMAVPGRTAFFIDKYLNTTTPLELDSTTTIAFDVESTPASYAPDRFMIILKQAAQVVPVRFTSISAVRNTDKTVTVRWDAANEINMQNYTVQYSADGVHFSNIGTQAPTNNLGGNASYSYVDGHASAATNYYRIRGNSLNGQVQYTAIAKVGPLAETQTLTIHPNPVTDNTLNLYFNNQPKGSYTVQVSNKLGQVLHTETIKVQNNNTIKMIKLAGNPSPASYQVTVTDETGNNNTIPFLIK